MDTCKNTKKEKINKIVTDFDNLLTLSKINIEDSYDKQLKIVKERNFLEKEHVKG